MPDKNKTNFAKTPRQRIQFRPILYKTIPPRRKNVTGCSGTVDGGNAPTADKVMSIALIFDRE